MLIDFTPEEVLCLNAGLDSWVNGPMGPYDMQEMQHCENAQSKIDQALDILFPDETEVKECNCEAHERIEAGDFPAGHWWWVCSKCNKKL